MLKGNGDGTFGAPMNFPNTSGFYSPAVAPVDLDNDGKLDVVVASIVYRIQIDDSNDFSAPLVVDRIVTPSQFTGSTLNAPSALQLCC